MTMATKKTYSWAFVSFFVILGIDMVTHLVMHGTYGFGSFAQTAAIGTFFACVGKSPVYLVHERVWAKLGQTSPTACVSCDSFSCTC